MAQLTIVTDPSDGDILRMRVIGTVDLAGGDALEEAVRPVLAEHSSVALDLSQVSFLDSSGLGALIALQEAAKDEGCELVLHDPSPAVARVLDITQTAPVFDVD